MSEGMMKPPVLVLALVILSVVISGHSSAVRAAPNQQDAGVPPFVDVSEEAGVTAIHQGIWDAKGGVGYLGVGQAWGDYDNDGWVDLFVTGNRAHNVLYLNNQDGTFSVSPLTGEVSMPDAVTGGAVWADYDNDGWPDLYVLAEGANALFHNDAGTGFTDVTAVAGLGDTGEGQSAAWGDYDGDGYLDAYVVNWTCLPECDPVDFRLHQDRLYHNNGDGSFTDVSGSLVYEKLLGAGFAASFVDYDNDQDLDLYVVNDEVVNPIGNILWRNDGEGCGGWCWTDISAEAGANVVLSGMGLAVGDYDNDGDLDFYFSNMTNPMQLLQNQGDGTFVDVAKEAGVSVGPTAIVGWGTAFFDYDNDGWLDLYLAATKFIQREIHLEPEGMHFSYPNALFRNNGDGTFTDVIAAGWADVPRPTKGIAFADYDNDGWIDFVVGNWNEGYRLYRNQGSDGSDNHWLTVSLNGEGSVNRDAVGARVYVTTEDGRTQMQEVKCGSSLGAGNDVRLHFGLGNGAIKEVRVVWPDGVARTFTNVALDQIWQLNYTDTEGWRPGGTTAALVALTVLLSGSSWIILTRLKSRDLRSRND